jgi:phage shock protein PspC (stress-responsive transcriptional regulator)
MSKRGLYRSRDHRVIAGVAAGLAERFGVPIWLMRLIWIILLLPGGFPGGLGYNVLWIISPEEPEVEL